MSVILMATADLPDESGFTGTVERSTEQARTGSRSYKTIWSNRSLTRPYQTRSTIYARIAFLTECEGQNYDFRNSTTIHVRLEINPSQGLIRIRRSTTLLADASGLTIPYNTWTVLEAKITIHDTLGEVILRLNGAEIYTLTGADTRLGAEAVVDNVQLNGGSGISYWDDILIDDANWPGLGGLYVLEPSGAGTHQDWTGSLPTLTTDAEVAGTKHTFTKDALPANAVNISAAGVALTSRVTGQGYGALKSLLGATEGAVAGQSVSSGYQLQLFDGPWSPVAFDALEVGVASA